LERRLDGNEKTSLPFWVVIFLVLLNFSFLLLVHFICDLLLKFSPTSNISNICQFWLVKDTYTRTPTHHATNTQIAKQGEEVSSMLHLEPTTVHSLPSTFNPQAAKLLKNSVRQIPTTIFLQWTIFLDISTVLLLFEKMFQRLNTVSVLRQETYLEDAVSSLQNIIADKFRTMDNVKKIYHCINTH
jgi:hypothetical protein